jgi:endo-1,4-beta-xylanase
VQKALLKLSTLAVTLAVFECASNPGEGEGGKGDDEGGSSGSSGSAGAMPSGGTSTGGSASTGGTNAGGAAGTSGTSPGGSGQGAGAGRGGGGGAGASKGGAGGGGGKGGSAGKGGTGGGPPIDKYVGNITTRNQVRSDFVTFWDQITPENEGKWGSVEAVRDRMNWAGTDAVRDYARQHGFPYKGHTLVWGSQQPDWIAGLPASEQRAEVEEWIREYCQRYTDVAMIDVVNEPPPHTTPSYMNAIGGAGTSGYDWIAQAFRWADQYCPKSAVLMLNDYNNIEYGDDVTRTIDIVKRVLAAGAPIEAVGAQSHDVYKLSASTVNAFINRVAAETGLPVYITEYDIDLASDSEQAAVMQAQFPMFWNNPHVPGITVWGYVSGQTWKPNTGLMSSSGAQRPAMVWLMDFLGR